MAQSNIFGLPGDSSFREVTLFDVGPDSTGSAILTGGDYGVEGSILTTALLAAVVFAAYRYYRRVEATRVADNRDERHPGTAAPTGR